MTDSSRSTNLEVWRPKWCWRRRFGLRRHSLQALEYEQSPSPSTPSPVSSSTSPTSPRATTSPPPHASSAPIASSLPPTSLTRESSRVPGALPRQSDSLGSPTFGAFPMMGPSSSSSMASDSSGTWSISKTVSLWRYTLPIFKFMGLLSTSTS
ncbi:hypothetical protein TorRG33x02_325100 [Trema orientale]|uniref:Uncharacterized protein n=1 Tax=Trema orientale TaxID=63057 RepID=A0A2P5BDI0_TREOI|nr:hypothetical protein TorRG33x02_325100 [Trema orientale]